jgi:hypothetical protein
MCDEAAALDREDKIFRRLVMPAGKGFGALQRIMRAVDLDRVEMPAGIGEFVFLAQLLRVKAAAPAGIAPAGDADADSASSSLGSSTFGASTFGGSTFGGMACGTAAHRPGLRRRDRIAAC